MRSVVIGFSSSIDCCLIGFFPGRPEPVDLPSITKMEGIGALSITGDVIHLLVKDLLIKLVDPQHEIGQNLQLFLIDTDAPASFDSISSVGFASPIRIGWCLVGPDIVVSAFLADDFTGETTPTHLGHVVHPEFSSTVNLPRDGFEYFPLDDRWVRILDIVHGMLPAILLPWLGHEIHAIRFLEQGITDITLIV